MDDGRRPAAGGGKRHGRRRASQNHDVTPGGGRTDGRVQSGVTACQVNCHFSVLTPLNG